MFRAHGSKTKKAKGHLRVRTSQDNPYSCIFGVYLLDDCLGHTETRPLHQHLLRNSAPAGAAHLKEIGGQKAGSRDIIKL